MSGLGYPTRARSLTGPHLRGHVRDLYLLKHSTAHIWLQCTCLIYPYRNWVFWRIYQVSKTNTPASLVGATLSALRNNNKSGKNNKVRKSVLKSVPNKLPRRAEGFLLRRPKEPIACVPGVVVCRIFKKSYFKIQNKKNKIEGVSTKA